jgi:membrane-associated phospholipid phosphatase
MFSAAETALLVAALVVAIACLRALAWRLVRLAIRATGWLRAAAAGPRVRERTRPILDRLRARAPRLCRWVEPRLDPDSFSGLPLTLLVVAALYIAGLFGGLVEEVMEAEGMQRLDLAINAVLAPWREQPWLAVFLWITELGAGPTLTAVSIVATGFLWAHRRPLFIVPLWVAFLGAQATTWLGKYAIARTRPEFIEAATAVSPSFPSGHTTAAMALYGFLAYVIARDLVSLRARFEIVFWAGMLAAAVGFSRIFLSVHYTSDVAAGYLVGGFWLLVGFALAEMARARAGAAR